MKNIKISEFICTYRLQELILDIQTFSGSEKKETYRVKLGIIFCLLFINICNDPSLEPSHRDGSNEVSQHVSFE